MRLKHVFFDLFLLGAIELLMKKTVKIRRGCWVSCLAILAVFILNLIPINTGRCEVPFVRCT